MIGGTTGIITGTYVYATMETMSEDKDNSRANKVMLGGELLTREIDSHITAASARPATTDSFVIGNKGQGAELQLRGLSEIHKPTTRVY